jgi:ribulose-phosphate 3-epimerase
MKIKIAPSILSADFGKINEEIITIEKSSDIIHIDVMDGNFVPNLTFGAPVVKRIKTRLIKDCHLMVNHPETYIKGFVDAGAGIITVHAEACSHLHGVIQQIKSFNIRVGVAINPHTGLNVLKYVVKDIDMLLIMSVNPGFGGQEFIADVLPKIEEARKLYPKLDIQVDGGINEKTAKEVIKAGANILVAGNYIFCSEDRIKAISSLRK